MAYTRTTLVSRPVESAFGITEELGDVWDTIKGGAGSVLDFFGSGLKAQGAQEALAAQNQQLAAQLAAKGGGGGGGISTTTLLIGGVVVAGVLVLALRRK
jgi:hypothetical protein